MSTYKLVERVCYRPLIFPGLRTRISSGRNWKKFRRRVSVIYRVDLKLMNGEKSYAKCMNT